MATPRIRVYYNSACPVCRAGIGLQQKKLARCGAAIAWKDVHTDLDARGEIDADLESVRERLHVVDEHGQMKVGVEAFEVLWRQSPRQRWKAVLLRLPLLKALSVRSYNAFARALYRWNRKKRHW